MNGVATGSGTCRAPRLVHIHSTIAGSSPRTAVPGRPGPGRRRARGGHLVHGPAEADGAHRLRQATPRPPRPRRWPPLSRSAPALRPRPRRRRWRKAVVLCPARAYCPHG
ncbi:hypothetical protein NKH77_47745 [Streptomyces sp. M19]